MQRNNSINDSLFEDLANRVKENWEQMFEDFEDEPDAVIKEIKPVDDEPDVWLDDK